MQWSKAALALAVALALFWAFAEGAYASDVTSSTSDPDPETGEVTVTFTVVATEGESITDFHIIPPVGAGYEVMGTVEGGPTGWVSSTSGDGVHWRMGDGSGEYPGEPIEHGNPPATFKIKVPKGHKHFGPVRWMTTSNNSHTAPPYPRKGEEKDPAIVDYGPKEGEPSTHGPLNKA